jgi:hypothetical protein
MSGKLGFVEDVSQLPTDQERQCMLSVPRGAFDLRSWTDVYPRAALILKHMRGEDGLALMPPGGWPADKVSQFSNWVNEGAPKRRGDEYGRFFRAIDGQTEYYDVYGSKEGLEDLGPFYRTFFGKDLLQGVWLDYMKIVPSTPLLLKQKQALWTKVTTTAQVPKIREGLLKIDEWLCSLVSAHFTFGGQLDFESLFDAFAAFGADVLPVDDDRAARVRALGDPSDYRLVNDFAKYHRMDSRSMWFFWFGHIQCVMAALQGASTPQDGVRTALLAALFVGQTTDTTYRVGSNGNTRPAYTGSQGRDNILTTARFLLQYASSAVSEMEELYLIWAGAIPPK